jgi:hypothetical protein
MPKARAEGLASQALDRSPDQRTLFPPSGCVEVFAHGHKRPRRLGAVGTVLTEIERKRMAKKRKRKYSRSASRDVEGEMRRYKRGTAKSGRGGKGGKVKRRKQAIAIGLSKARKKGKKVPRKKS